MPITKNATAKTKPSSPRRNVKSPIVETIKRLPDPPPIPPAVMDALTARVRFLVDIRGSRRGTFLKGQTAILPIDIARDWLKSGLVEFDKSLDGPPETK